MKHFIRVFKKTAGLRLSQDMAYKWNFFIKIFAVMLQDMIGPLIVLLIYSTTAGIPGWSIYEFILFQGTFLLVFGIGHFMFVMIPVEVISSVRRGTFDKVLTKPFNTLAFLTASAIDWDGLAEVIIGIALIAVSFSKLSLSVVSLNFVIFLYLIGLAVILQYALMVLISASAFIFIQSWALLDLAFKLTDFARYPSNIYGLGLQFMLTFIFPIAISAFYPVEALLRGFTILGVLKLTIPILLFLGISLILWKFAMRKYTSAGG